MVNNKFEFITGNLLTSKDVDENSLGILLSDSTEILLKLKKLKGRFNNFLTCENPFSTSEAYKLCDILLDNKKPNYKYFKLINTGTIDPFVSLWGRKQTTYLKSRYTYPIASLSNLKIYFPKRLIQIRSPKLIITGMRYLECFNDYNGEYIAGKSTLIIREILDDKFNLFCALLNSKLVSFYIKQSFSSLGIDGGVNFSKRIIENIPIPIIKKSQENIISRIVSDINKNNNTNQDTTKLEQQIDNMVYKLYNLDYDVVKVIDPEYKFTKQEYTEIQC